MEITKEQTIKLWKKCCSKVLDNNDISITDGTYSVKASENVEITIVVLGPPITVSIVFAGSIRYKSFDLNQEEAQECLDILNERMEKNRVSEKNDLMNTGIEELRYILSYL